ncbi:MAG: type I-F CRISPR-associated endoribonuclease Cas6/Csy4 [Methylophaga sp.]|nr:type I-F CRISPR-associated endoribonuclease Cas6/Csy4 [Methylophaga sp.]
MDFYLDIKIKPDAEMRKNELLNKVYTKLHKALFSLDSTAIGVSFPKYNVILGNILRIHGTESQLTALQAVDWLGGLSGYCDTCFIEAIPNEVAYRTIFRKQSNMTEAKLRRLIDRRSISQDQIKAYRAKMFTQGMDNPYLELVSATNGHKHRRYIEFGELKTEATRGEFDTFGLSKTGTIPWF